MPRLFWLLLLLLLHTVTAATTTTTTATSSFEFQLSNDFYSNKCDPCIPRTDYWIQAFLHGTVNDIYWQQVQLALEQASRDTGIDIQVTLYSPEDIDSDVTIPERMALDILAAAAASASSSNTNTKRPDALIVTLPTKEVEDAVREALQEQNIPIFGFHTGYQVAQELGLLGFVAQDEFVAGQVVARELVDLFLDTQPQELEVDTVGDNSTSNATILPTQQNQQQTKQEIKVAYINHDPLNPKFEARHSGIQSILLLNQDNSTTDNNNKWQVDQIYIDLENLFDAVNILEEQVFVNCTYDVVVLAGADDVDIALSALVQDLENTCSTDKTTILATFESSATINEALINGQLAFAAVSQDYLQSIFVGVMAGLFVTTGKKLSLPHDSRVYLSGPRIITQENVPTDSIQTCLEQAFPVCDARGNAQDDPVTTNPDGMIESNLCNGGCLPRANIRIGGVLHGVSSDSFWDPVFAAAHQAALDVGITMDLERLEPQSSSELVFSKMAARIRTLCESGVDGIFVTIPDESLVEPIQLCQSLNIPVISINAGGDISERLGLLHHIGQVEYSAGYGAGQRLVREGMLEGYCVNHAWGNIVLEDRCRGFEDAIAEHDNVVYHGMFQVAEDNNVQYIKAVEEAVAKSSPDADSAWSGIGLLCLGASQMSGALAVQEKHRNVILGSFDLSDEMFEPFADGRLKFGIDQQPFLQGSFPVYLLAYAAYSRQSLRNNVVETGPKFVDSQPSEGENTCVANSFAICSILPEEDMQLIDSKLLAVGYFMVGLTIGTALFCMAWTLYYQKKSQLVRVSQPMFLLLLCGGCIISCLSIIFMGIQTEYRYIKDDLTTGMLTDQKNPDAAFVDASCMAVPWLHATGSVIVFSSLFAKIWKIKMIFKAGEAFRRRIVGVMDILPYVAGMFTIVFGLLISWQVAAPFRWEREVTQEDVDGYALESLGECTSDDGWWYWLALLCFQIGCLFYALVLCFQCKEIPDDFSESSYVSLAVICMFQVMVLAMPISAMTKDDTDVFYFVRSCAVFLQNYTVLCLLFVPKMWRLFTGDDELPLMQNTRSKRRSQAQMQSMRSSHFNNPSSQWANSPSQLHRQASSQFSEPFQVNSQASLHTSMPSKESEVPVLSEESAPTTKDTKNMESLGEDCSPLSSAAENSAAEEEDVKDETKGGAKIETDDAALNDKTADTVQSALSVLTTESKEHKETGSPARIKESEAQDQAPTNPSVASTSSSLAADPKSSTKPQHRHHYHQHQYQGSDVSSLVGGANSLIGGSLPPREPDDAPRPDPPGSPVIGGQYDIVSKGKVPPEQQQQHPMAMVEIPKMEAIPSPTKVQGASSLKRALEKTATKDDEGKEGGEGGLDDKGMTSNMKNVTWAMLM